MKWNGTTSKSKDTVDNFGRRKAEFLEQVNTTVVIVRIDLKLGSNVTNYCPRYLRTRNWLV